MQFKIVDLLIHQDVERLAQLMDVGVLPDLRMGDQGNPHHDKGLLEHTMAVVENVSVDPVMKLAAFFHDSGKPSSKAYDEGKDKFVYNGHDQIGASVTREHLGGIGVPESDIEVIVTLVSLHMRPLNHFNQPFGQKGLKRLMRSLDEGGATVDQLMELNRADILAHSSEVIERNMPMHEDLRNTLTGLAVA